MMRKWLIAALLGLCSAPLAAESGSLLIVGGGMRDQDGAILSRLRAQMPDPGGRVAIIPAASGEASVAISELTEKLAAVGIAPENVSAVHIAMIDDELSSGVDEGSWAGNASDLAEIAKIAAADAIWFTGGDQLRTFRLLVNPDGSDTPMLAAIRTRLAAGAVVAGTSAGAAIMGSGMIVCGTPDIAATGQLSRNPADCDVPDEQPVPLVLGKGLGFLKGAVIDQHFSQRNRWVRLLRATACAGGDVRYGFGIDEDSALLIRLESGRAEILGAGGVARAMVGKSGACKSFAFDRLTLSYKRAGHKFSIKRGLGD